MFRSLLRRRPAPGTIMGALALFITLGGVGYAATGGSFILGQANTATTPSSLSAPVAGKTLQLTNTSTGTGATALGLTVASGKAPFTVNSTGKVTNLNADRIDSLDSTAFLRSTGKAADSNLLDGIDSTGFYAAGDKVADSFHADSTESAFNSGQLDGLDSTQFIKGTGQVASGAATLALSTFFGTVLEVPNKFRLSYYCPSDPTDNGLWRFLNLSPNGLNVFADSGNDNPTYMQVATNGVVELGGFAAGESYDFQVQGAFGIATIKAASVNRASNCHAQALTVING